MKKDVRVMAPHGNKATNSGSRRWDTVSALAQRDAPGAAALITRRSILAMSVVLVVGCHSAVPPSEGVQQSEPSLAATEVATSPGFTWPLPENFPSFGTVSQQSMRVAIFGYAVKQPGYYYLPPGATVHDAIEAAHGLGNIVGWQRPYSGIQRRRPDGSVETVWFTRAGRSTEEQINLRDGDRLRISHEVS